MDFLLKFRLKKCLKRRRYKKEVRRNKERAAAKRRMVLSDGNVK
jgi:hypothetical protein